MTDKLESLNNPWLVAAWPGMGSVAMLAGSHLVASLGAEMAMDLPASEFFEIEHVDVQNGLATPGHLPRNLFLLWRDPHEQRDLVIFIAEAQPRLGGYRLCRRIAEYAQQWNIQRITTFAAMATQLHPARDAGVFAVTTDREIADECRRENIQLLEQGQVSGLNGLMLAAAAEAQIPGLCLMGEMPYFAVNVPNPPASLAALRSFGQLANIDLDLVQLEQQAEHVQQQLNELVERLTSGEQAAEGEEAGFTTPNLSWEAEAPEEESPARTEQPPLSPEVKQRIESLFEQVEQDRSKAIKLKNELDRLNVFDQYEDRFLDLFRKGG